MKIPRYETRRLKRLAGSAILAGAAALCSVQHARASNPFITMQYGADPSAHVFDGIMYVYATHDRVDAHEFDTVDYHCYSTSDMVNWTDNGVIFSLAQSGWAKSHLWAPDCAYANGKYYLYYPAQDASGVFHIGVAVATTPTGPFVDKGTPIAGTDGDGDPAAFVDDDGQAYLFWGGGPTGCKLNGDMESLSGSPTTLAGCPSFFEGPWMFKRNGTYYFTYPALMPGGSNDGGNGQYWDYATGTSPLGPFSYKGHFSRTSAAQPQAGNIHGSQVLWNNTWYCFYHDNSMSTPYVNSGFKRDLDVDLLNFNADGTIQQLAWTQTGPPAIGALDPYSRCEAETLNQTDAPEGPHAVNSEVCSEGGIDIGNIENGDWMKYANVNFSSGAISFRARVASPVAGNTLQVHLDSLTGPLVCTCAIPNTGGWQTWQTATCPVSGVSGTHSIYLVGSGGAGGGLFNINWFQFTHSTHSVSNGVYEVLAKTTGNALDCTGCSNANGTTIGLWTAWGGNCQQWAVSNKGNGTYSIRNVNADGSLGRSLDATGCSPNNGTQLELWDYGNGVCQQWTINGQPDGFYSIGTNQAKSDGTKDVLDGNGCSGAAGTNVILWQWGGGGCQQEWSFAPIQPPAIVSGAYYTLTNVAAGLNLDNPNGTNVAGTKVQLFPANGATAQSWKLTKQADGNYTITCQAGGLNVDDPNGLGQGTQQQLWPANGATAQEWKITPAGAGAYTLTNVAANLCLDDPNGSNVAGTQLQLWPSNGAVAQQWRITPQ